MTERYHHGDLRTALLEAAVALIEEHGVHGLSLREAARRVGVSHAAPYRHFADKNALLLALAEQGSGWLADAGEAAMQGIADPTERLNAYGIAYVRFAFRHPVHFRVLFTESLELPPDHQPMSRAFQLLVDAAHPVAGLERDPMLSALSAWSWPHGLSLLILDGRIPRELVPDEEAAARLARRVAAQLGGTLNPDDR